MDDEDNSRIPSAVGGLSVHTKNTGDGVWCPFCYRNHGKFTWCDIEVGRKAQLYKEQITCPVHKITIDYNLKIVQDILTER